jgi:hypothetical protein
MICLIKNQYQLKGTGFISSLWVKDCLLLFKSCQVVIHRLQLTPSTVEGCFSTIEIDFTLSDSTQNLQLSSITNEAFLDSLNNLLEGQVWDSCVLDKVQR